MVCEGGLFGKNSKLPICALLFLCCEGPMGQGMVGAAFVVVFKGARTFCYPQENTSQNATQRPFVPKMYREKCVFYAHASTSAA